MKHKRYVRLAVVVFVIAAAFSVFAPAAFAGRITCIQYAQTNFDTYMYKAGAAAGNFWSFEVGLSWGNSRPSSYPVWPVAVINGLVQTKVLTGTPEMPYQDLGNSDIYSGSENPLPGPGKPTEFTVRPNQEFWIGIQPYAGEAISYSLWIHLDRSKTWKAGNPEPAGFWYGKNGTYSPVAATNITVTGTGYAPEGEYYKDNSIGQWYSCVQYWPGNDSSPTTDWNLYTQARADYDAGPWPSYTYPYSWYSNTADLYDGNGDMGQPLSSGYLDAATERNIWLVAAPQPWSAAATITSTPPTSNVWPGGSLPLPLMPNLDWTCYPKPGSKPATGASSLVAWVTHSITQDTRVTRPGFAWAAISTASASKRSVASINAYNSRAKWRYQGAAFDWVFTTGSRAGIARVYVDGTPWTPTGYPNPDVNQYSASTTYGVSRSYSVGGASTTWHEVVVSGTGRSSSTTTPKGYYIYHDKFVDPDDITPAAENNYDLMTSYAWPKLTVGGASGGAIVSNATYSSPMAFTFQCLDATVANRKIKWVYPKAPSAGIVNVYIDGQFVGTVDQFNGALIQGQSTTWTSGVTYAGQVLSLAIPRTDNDIWHTIFIIGSGTSNSTYVPKRYWIYSDAFRAEAQATVECED